MLIINEIPFVLICVICAICVQKALLRQPRYNAQNYKKNTIFDLVLKYFVSLHRIFLQILNQKL